MDDAGLLQALAAAADAVASTLAQVVDKQALAAEPSQVLTTQYAIDVAADAAAVAVLVGAGLGVLSEESGRHPGALDVVVVLDPVDGSTNASRGIPWYATSLAAVDGEGLRAALVVNQASGERFDATRGGGARLDGRPITASGTEVLGDALVALSGHPGRHRGRPLGWAQHRVLGAAALDLCAVACGRLDAFVDTHESGGLGPWDHLGGLLICQEAGAVGADALGRELVTLGPGDRRAPVVAATEPLLEALLGALAS
ncbi:MAG: Inositol-1-monophosphatase [uncultured Acidimicrobiales bacterium]|uniref:Inositol-1-monophosphatase n=1 Tax=uncultured Acidimicrobiales bacterium TaxID=310071 RepID=A0A6J4H710_9ACTN|nr:MAG: Inositol-1-monophosphatase [uncultured Acidimicrobiales bacterium]